MLSLVSLIVSNWRLFAIGAAVAGGLGWLTYEHHKIFDEGQQAAIQQVEKANVQEFNRANQGSQSVDSCYAGGGAWDRARGVCVNPAR